MKKIIFFFTVVTFLFWGNQLLAQKAKKNNHQKEETKPMVITTKDSHFKMIYPYLGHSNLSNGNISKRLFDSLLHQGLTAKDTAGNVYKIEGFVFGYAERNLYEDSVGKLMILSDYINEYCPGDTVSTAISLNIYYKTKPGDTAYFDKIKAILPSGGETGLRSMKFVLTK